MQRSRPGRSMLAVWIVLNGEGLDGEDLGEACPRQTCELGGYQCVCVAAHQRHDGAAGWCPVLATSQRLWSSGIPRSEVLDSEIVSGDGGIVNRKRGCSSVSDPLRTWCHRGYRRGPARARCRTAPPRRAGSANRCSVVWGRPAVASSLKMMPPFAVGRSPSAGDLCRETAIESLHHAADGIRAIAGS